MLYLCSDKSNYLNNKNVMRIKLIRIILLIMVNVASVLVFSQDILFDDMRHHLITESLPLVNLKVDSSSLNGYSYTMGEIEIANYSNANDSLHIINRYYCRLKYRGTSAMSYEKKSFAVKLIDSNGNNLDVPVLGMREENNWILDAMAIDRIRMRNRVCFDIWNCISRTPYPTSFGRRNGTEGRFVELFINGRYHGLYCFTDKIDRKLLGLKKAKVEEDGKVLVRGLLYKGQNWNSKDDIYLLSYKDSPTDSVIWNSWELQYPDDYPSSSTWNPLMELIDFCSAHTPDDLFEKNVDSYFYLDNLIDYVIFTFALHVEDNLYKNTFLSVVDITSQHKYLISPWDMDASMGGAWDGSYNDRVVYVDRYNMRAPFNRLMVNINGFYDEVKCRWEQYRDNVLSVDSVFLRIDRYAEQFIHSGAWERELRKWDGNPVPLKPRIEEELEYVKNWYERNYDHLCALFFIPDDIQTAKAHVAENKFFFSVDGIVAPRYDNKSVVRKGIFINDGKKIMVK